MLYVYERTPSAHATDPGLVKEIEQGDALTCVLALLERLDAAQLTALRVSHIGQILRARTRAGKGEVARTGVLRPAPEGVPPFVVDGALGEHDEDGDEVQDPTPLHREEPAGSSG